MKIFQSEIVIELASASDAEEIAKLSREYIEAGLGWNWTPEKVTRSIKKRTVNVAVAKRGNTIAGFGIMRYGENKANLDLLAVEWRFRRKGIGTRLIKWLEEVAYTAGIFHMYVQLRKSNKAAEKLYSKLGYELVSEVPGYYRLVETAMVMYKDGSLFEEAT